MSRRMTVGGAFRHVLAPAKPGRRNPWPKCGTCFHRVPPPLCPGCHRCPGCCETCQRCPKCAALCQGHEEER